MTQTPWELKAPRVLGVKLSGQLSGWASPKDIILNLAGQLTVRGGTGYIIEYFGPGVDSLSATGMATICNMGAEVGATTSIFPMTRATINYLTATNRAPAAKAAEEVQRSSNYLAADMNAQYDNIIEIDMSTLEPHINGPFTPDLSHTISDFKNQIQINNWPEEMSCGLIGSCTNSSYEDMSKVVSIVQQADKAGLKPVVPFLVTPGSEQIRATIEDDGITETLRKSGAIVLANACGPCVGQWNRTDLQPSVDNKIAENSILTSFNRNFRARNDGSPKTMNFLASPEIVTAIAYAGKMTFDPTRDSIGNFKFEAPTGQDLPPSGFSTGDISLTPLANPTISPNIQVIIDLNSERLQILDPFPPFTQDEFIDLKVLFKVKGKCTTDHISAAGTWLKYKGHLENISNNTLIGATNAETGEVNRAYDTDGSGMSIPDLARKWKARGQEWLVVGDQNYGEGSAREHAALQPRYLGGRIILCRSFARIHEANLKKQGILPLTFAHEQDYDKISSCDDVETIGIRDLLNATSTSGLITLKITKKDGSVESIPTKHTMSPEQVEYFKAGSALALVKLKASK